MTPHTDDTAVVCCTADRHARLKALAHATGYPMRLLVDHAIDRLLEQAATAPLNINATRDGKKRRIVATNPKRPTRPKTTRRKPK